MSGRVKRSIAVAVRVPTTDAADEILAVRRPPDHEDLPDAWGLPAGSLRGHESWEDAVRRAGREKLGVDLTIDRLLNEGELTRGDPARDGYVLRMRLYEARLAAGEARVPQPVAGVTQYAALEPARPERFLDAARRGSLCCRLWLEVTRPEDVRDGPGPRPSPGSMEPPGSARG